MSTIFEWPSPPHFDLIEKTSVADTQSGVLVMNDGRRLSGALVRLDPHTSVVEFHPDRAANNTSIGFSNFKRLCLTQPIELRHNDISPNMAGMEANATNKEKCRIRFKDGDELFAETVGFVPREYGLFLFLINSSNLVMRWFIPADMLASYEIGDQLGKLLVDNKIVTAEEVDAGLEKQQELRSQKLGHYLTRDEIVTPEQMQIALQIMKNKPQLKLGEALLEEKLITERQLREALEKQLQDRKTPLGEVLVSLGFVDRPAIRRILSQKLGIPSVNLNKFQFDLNVIKAVPPNLVHKHSIMPLYRTATRIVVAIENPLVWESLQALEFYTQLKVDPVMATIEELEIAIQRFYGAKEEVGQDITDIISELGASSEIVDVPEDAIDESDNVLVRLVNKIIMDAYEQRASDIHIECVGGERPSKVRFRKDGVMTPYSDIPRNFRAAVVSRIKIMSSLDISEKRRSQDGKIAFENFGPAKIELRVATMPTNDGLEDIVMRILAAPKAISIDDVGLDKRILESLKSLAAKPQGLLFVCGPTGSGKTTTLHSLLGFINTPDRKIWTAEDPIEITQDGLRQVQVNPKIGWTFANVLRSFLRVDPDVIMVGETRDVETARIVIEASLTGHLVLSTMHTNGAVESVVRLLDFGLDPFNFADALNGVIGQRLARALCASCKKSYEPSVEELDMLAHQYCLNTELNPSQVINKWKKTYSSADGKILLHGPVGCGKCDHGGYKGRLGVYELLEATPNVRKKIYSRATVQEIQLVANNEGMITMKQDGIDKIFQGLTDFKQVISVCV